MDITGPFPKHKTSVDGILTVVDRLTKFAMFLPCRYHAKAPELVEVLYASWIRTKGYPKEIVCDRDTRFMSDFWLALVKRWGSSLKPISARHPQTDGQMERAHQTAQVLLRTLIRPDQKDWVERLPDVELACNSSIHPTIGMSPFEFEHGSPVASPLDTIIPRTAESDDNLLFLRQMQELLVKARDQMAKTQQCMSRQTIHQRLPCPFRADDLVWVSAAKFSLEQDISRKLLPKWMGPWSIVAPAGDASEGPSFTIQVSAHLLVYPVFHCSKLALYTPAEHDDLPRRRSPDPPYMDGFQEVDDIISQRRYSNRPTDYLVHFAYCTHKVDRWLTRAELQATALDVLARYERKMQGKPVSSAPRRTRVQVRLLGYCNRKCLCLVYEYCANGSLSFNLRSRQGHVLDWLRRVQIALDAAEGLKYIHTQMQPTFVHRDVKSDNILLDANFRGKLGDFGLARDGPTAATTYQCGSFGYIPPEYTKQIGNPTTYGDIYAFGVVLFEIVTGRLPIDRPTEDQTFLLADEGPLLLGHSSGV
ncbi:hypothetical protein CBR_g64824 [Chara braunii]|uniref:Protein kinase domain-containing protein n=1 Tax=Chara braunii TaxID=69332 RepID=A0A388K901_CHABU|nr:hypothetical protein CBR_g64824 [Chara braunii]|eukprot:GBG66554.1 hypothetical protein CBR_g64824 [Chara braunii]